MGGAVQRRSGGAQHSTPHLRRLKRCGRHGTWRREGRRGGGRRGGRCAAHAAHLHVLRVGEWGEWMWAVKRGGLEPSHLCHLRTLDHSILARLLCVGHAVAPGK